MEKRIVEPKTIAGFMELLPSEQILFNQMVDTIRKSYESFGFLPLDTPIIEYSEVLLAKAGGETEKQVYSFTKGESELTLRFDLTVPLAKYVAFVFRCIGTCFGGSTQRFAGSVCGGYEQKSERP